MTILDLAVCQGVQIVCVLLASNAASPHRAGDGRGLIFSPTRPPRKDRCDPGCQATSGGDAAAGAPAAPRGAGRPAGRRSWVARTSPQGMCGSTNCATRRHSRGETGETRGGERARECVCWSGLGEEPVQAGSSQRTPAPMKPAQTSSMARLSQAFGACGSQQQP